VKRFGGIFDYENKKHRLEEVELRLSQSGVWDDPETAQQLNQERSSLERIVSTLERVFSSIKDSAELLEMAAAESDEETLEVIETDLGEVESQLTDLEFQRMFQGELDDSMPFLKSRQDQGVQKPRTGRKCCCACT